MSPVSFRIYLCLIICYIFLSPIVCICLLSAVLYFCLLSPVVYICLPLYKFVSCRLLSIPLPLESYLLSAVGCWSCVICCMFLSPNVCICLLSSIIYFCLISSVVYICLPLFKFVSCRLACIPLPLAGCGTFVLCHMLYIFVSHCMHLSPASCHLLYIHLPLVSCHIFVSYHVLYIFVTHCIHLSFLVCLPHKYAIIVCLSPVAYIFEMFSVIYIVFYHLLYVLVFHCIYLSPVIFICVLSDKSISCRI